MGKRILLFIALLSVVLAAAPAFATTYEVGPGKPYANIRDVPWESIAAGDTVLIYYRATPYKEKFNITVDATESQPFVVRGVAGGGGELPVLDGQDAVTRTQLTYPSDERAIINVGRANNKPAGFVTTYVTIENLEIIHARSPFSYTSDDGTVVNFGDGANGIYAAGTEHLVLRNLVLHDNGEGFFFSSSDGYGTTKYMIAEGNYVYGNGHVGSDQIHNSYCESMGLTYQYNHYGPLISGSTGNNLKDRSSNLVIRYNWIESGDRLMDLVDAEDSSAIRADPNYNKAFVYGNILVKVVDPYATGKILHFGGDGKKSSYYKVGPLQLYNNTLVSYRTDPTYFIRGSTSAVVTDCYNNVAYVTAAGSNLQISYNAGTVNLSHNWLKTGWIAGPGVVNDDGTQVTGSEPGFADFANQDFHLAAGSACINAGKPLPSIDLPDNNVVSQYVKHQAIEPRQSDGALDIGAYEFAGPPADLVITTTSLPNGQVGVAYSQALQAMGGIQPYAWSITAGSLPQGLSLNGSTGVISGTPSQSQTAYFTVQVLDSQDPPDSDTQALSITISSYAPLDITTTSLPNARRGRAYSQTLQATGGLTPYTWSLASGSLPPGLALGPSTGVISGSATSTGTWPFTARVTDSQSPPATDDQPLSITVTK